jgi:uncharacterized protein (TIGR03083 family)
VTTGSRVEPGTVPAVISPLARSEKTRPPRPAYIADVRVFDMVVHERRHMADVFAGLTPEQLRQPSLCDGWTMHDVAAHLTTFLRFGQAKLYLGIVTTAADFDRYNVQLTERAARRPTADLIAALRRWSTSRTTIPRSGYDPVLTDLVLHDLDVRLPLGIPRTMPEEPLWVAFNHLATRPALGFSMDTRLQDLQITATDTGWSYGSGAPVRGTAEDLLLGMGGRAVAFDRLEGDGLPMLRERVAAPPRVGPVRRLRRVIGVVLNPPPPDRRTRAATGPR